MSSIIYFVGFFGNTTAWAASLDAICISTAAAPDEGLKIGLLDCGMTVEDRCREAYRCGEVYRCGEMYRCDRCRFGGSNFTVLLRSPHRYLAHLDL